MKKGVLFMERTMSVEDKIRRAEEIYNRRRENEYRTTNTRVRVDNNRNSSNKNVNLRLKKMIIQIIVCMIIYLIFYYIINNNYVLSEDFRNKCEEILSYDISFSEMYKSVSETITTIEQKYHEVVEASNEESNGETSQDLEKNLQIQSEEANTNEDVENQNSNTNSESAPVENIQEETQTNVEESIGGAVEEVSNIEEAGETEKLSEEEQMRKDAEYIKSKISFINPLKGVITSKFGWRNPTVSTVSKYHTGIDIGVDEGTPIVSATEGKVILASSKGAYGNHLKIQIEDIIIIYAHCLSLEVSEGEEVNQGQLIARVGSTGNSTGPHLHFEIRIQDRYVDPKLILDY